MKIDRYDAVQNSIYGTFRGIAVHILTNPLNVVRKLQQSSTQGSSYQISATLYKDGGVRAFFTGLSTQLIRTSLKQVWVWPVMIQAPAMVPIDNPIAKQAAIGFVIAGVDATITTPLERANVLLITKKKWRWKDAYKGYWTNFLKLSICWASFLAGQKFFRDRNIQPGEKANAYQLLNIGLKTTLFISVISAPFDVANTQKIANNVNFITLIRQNKMRTLFRGYPLHFLALLVQSVASIALIDQLEKR